MLKQFWNQTPEEVLMAVESTLDGLSSKQAEERLKQFGLNRLKPKKKTNTLYLLWAQFRSPLVLLLLVAAGFSFVVYDHADAYIILGIVAVTALLGFSQEKSAAGAMAQLLKTIEVKTEVMRDATIHEVNIERIVPGDIIYLNAGDIIPGDCYILESKDLFVDEATLTGESFGVEKKEAILPPETPFSKRTNLLFLGTHVISGTAKVVVFLTGKQTEFGKVAAHLKYRPPETSFELGVRRFGYFLLTLTITMVTIIFLINLFLDRTLLQACLFALSLAVGLTPQLLPAIISVNLARGAKRMAKHKVIVKRLASIENFGSMTLLCTDKTGTVTQGIPQVRQTLDYQGEKSEKVLRYAFLNSHFQTGYSNSIDDAITAACPFDTNGWRKLDEIPYDFKRKRLSVLMTEGKEPILISKGAFAEVIATCLFVEKSSGEILPLEENRQRLEQLYQEESSQGFRLIALAYKPSLPHVLKAEDEQEMIFLGFIVLEDPLKEKIVEVVHDLKKEGIGFKLITGDNRFVSARIGQEIGFVNPQLMTGAEIATLSDDVFKERIAGVDIFVEVEPNQKEKIILAYRKAGAVVGYMGDGINDATALHAADVGISVDTAADVAREVADIVLLKKDLSVLKQGVREGRKTFANTMKYIFMATSANFGNMFSMAGASIFMPFLPLLPKQILLTNLLTDFPEMTIATDYVDHDLISKPIRWDVGMIRRFMIIFGLISSIFDYLTFGLLLWVLKAPPELFRTGWFVESVASAVLIVLVIRTHKPFYKSRPSFPLLFTVLAVLFWALILPYLAIPHLFSFQVLPPYFYVFIGGVLIAYVGCVEWAKRWFFRSMK